MAINLEGLTPSRTVRMGGLVEWDDATTVPNGLAIVCQNMAFLAEGVKVRWGLRTAMKLVGVIANPTGVDVLTVLGSPQAPVVKQQAGGASVSVNSLSPEEVVSNQQGNFVPIPPSTQVGIVFTDAGELLIELPAGSGNMVPLAGLNF